MDILYFIIATVLSLLFFNILLNALNKSMLRLFVPLQNFTNKLKRKKQYKTIGAGIFIFLCIIKDFFKLGYISYGIILGFFITLNEVIFDINKESL